MARIGGMYKGKPCVISPSKTEHLIVMEIHLKELGLEFEREFQFAKSIGRRWRFDWCVPRLMLAIECEGIVWKGDAGRHQRATGMSEDLHKYATAMSLGWSVWRFSPQMILRGEAKEFLALWLKSKQKETR